MVDASAMAERKTFGSVMASGDTATTLQASKHDLDRIASCKAALTQRGIHQLEIEAINNRDWPE